MNVGVNHSSTPCSVLLSLEASADLVSENDVLISTVINPALRSH